MKLARITIYKLARLESGGASSSGGCSEVVIVDPPWSNGLQVLFKRDADCTGDIDAVKMELQKEWVLRDEEHSLLKTIRTDSLELVKFQWKGIKRNKLLVEDVEALQNKLAMERQSKKSLKKI